MGSKSKIDEQDIREWLNTRLLVVDEISFAGYNSFLMSLSKNLQSLTESNDHLYGRVAIVFIGDFLQLEPVASKDCIYKVEDSYYWELHLNIMIELQGKWRFKDCQHLQDAFDTMRQEGMTPELKKLFDTRVISDELKIPENKNIKIATWTNRKKEDFNNAMFMNHLKMFHSQNEEDPTPQCTVIVHSQIAWKHNNRILTQNERNRFFDKACETDTRELHDKSKRVDPMLKLFFGCNVMVTQNEDVANGIANGTTAVFERLVLKPLKLATKIRYNGYWVLAVDAQDVDYVELSWSHDSTFKGKFSVKAKSFVCSSTIQIPTESTRSKRVEVQINLSQFPLSINNTTTGHKLQGKTVDYLFLGEYAKSVKNWLYVVLSRVRKLENLYLLEPIPVEENSAPDPRMTSMIQRLRSSIMIDQDSDIIKELRQKILDDL